jgi:polysaccharide export outer membrane protein
MRRHTLAIVFLVLGILSGVAARAGAQPPAQASEHDYVVGPQDVLNITVFNEQTLSGRFTVESDGSLTYPLVGRVPVAGKTLRAIQEDLIKRLAAGYLVNPQVAVQVEQFRSQSIFIVGEVRQPGKHTISGNMTLLEALSQAGGMTASAGTEVVVRRPKGVAAAGPVDPADDSRSDVIARVNLEDLQSGKATNVSIRDGDTIFVPKAEMFFVTGYVRSPGSYVWEKGMTVLKAISLAGGITERGSSGRVRIIRIMKGERKEIRVQMTDLVLPNDTVDVPQRYF